MRTLCNFSAARWLFVAAALLIASASGNGAAAQDMELRDKFGLWSLYCGKGADQPKYQNCSITAGVHAKDNPDLWTKVAVSIASPAGDLEMTVRTPFLKYLRSGISLGFDGRQIVKGIVDSCSATTCESTIALDDRLVELLGIGDKMSVEYQVAADKSILLILDLDQMVRALGSLGQHADLTSTAIASAAGSRNRKMAGGSDAKLFVLERRKFEQGKLSPAAAAAWKAPLKKCSGSPATKKVIVTDDLTLQNEKEVLDWAEKSSKCTNEAVAWIRQENAGSETGAGMALDQTRIRSWIVYNSVSKVMPTGVVPGDDSRVPIHPQTTGYLSSTSGAGTSGFGAVR